MCGRIAWANCPAPGARVCDPQHVEKAGDSRIFCDGLRACLRKSFHFLALVNPPSPVAQVAQASSPAGCGGVSPRAKHQRSTTLATSEHLPPSPGFINSLSIILPSLCRGEGEAVIPLITRVRGQLHAGPRAASWSAPALWRFGPTTVRNSNPHCQPNHRRTILPLPQGAYALT